MKVLEFIRNLSIQKKILSIVAVNVIVLLVVGVGSYTAINKSDQVKSQIAMYSSASSKQLTADMMHDAIRADVYKALLVDSANVLEYAGVKEELNEHVSTFESSIAALNELAMDSAILNQSAKVQGPLSDYVKESQNIISLCSTGNFDRHSASGKLKLENYNAAFQKLAVEMGALSAKIEEKKTSMDAEGSSSVSELNSIFYFLIFIFVLVVVLSVYIIRLIVNPLKQAENVLTTLSEGGITKKLVVEGKDETAVMMTSLNSIVDNLNNVKDFVKEVGDGNFDSQITIFNNKGEIFESLNKMKLDLKNVSEEDRKRAWTTEGLAKFADILRVNYDTVAELSDEILFQIVKYLGANQGFVFVINDNVASDSFMEMTAAFAWDRKKHEQATFKYGEGLIGRCWREKDTVYLTEIPDGYVRITSGVGEANPRNIVLVPMKLNEEIFGVIEIATFYPLEKYQVSFLEKLAESIASTISSAKVNERTKLLLDESQKMTEQMKMQEEEMRQNMEEMTATQSEMQRMQRHMEMEKKRVEEEFAAQLNIINSVAIVSKTDLKGNITYVNDNFLKYAKYTKEEVIGKNHRILKSGDQDDQIFVEMWKTISAGKIFRGEIKNKAKDGSFYWVDAIVAPVLDANGKPKEYIAQRFVINEQKRKEEEMQQMMEEVQAQEEEIRQNMEEMAATQEQVLAQSRAVEKAAAENKGIIDGVNATMATIEFTPEGEVVTANENFCTTMKCTVAQIKGKHHRTFVPQDILLSDDYKTFWTRLSMGIDIKGEFKRVNAAGEIVWLNAIYNPIKDHEGKVVKVVKFATDITAQKLLEAESKAQTDIINAVAIVSKTDLKGNITYVNDEFLKWSKYRKEEVMGKNHRMLKSGDQDDQIFVEMWKTISSGRVFRGEIKNKAKDGSFYWVDAIVAPILDENGKPKEYIAQRFVINEQKRKEEEMQQMLEEVQAQEEEIRQNMEEMAATQEQVISQSRVVERAAAESKGILEGINATMATIEFTPEGTVVDANSNFLNAMKCTLSDIKGQHHSNFVTKAMKDSKEYQSFWTNLAAGKSNKGVFERVNAKGEIVWLNAIYNPLKDSEGKVVKVIKFATDITEQVQKEAEMQKLLEELKKKK